MTLICYLNLIGDVLAMCPDYFLLALTMFLNSLATFWRLLLPE